ncbi:hypothetical protein ScPMuIL_004121 [Solemya velum]
MCHIGQRTSRLMKIIIREQLQKRLTLINLQTWWGTQTTALSDFPVFSPDREITSKTDVPHRTKDIAADENNHTRTVAKTSNIDKPVRPPLTTRGSSKINKKPPTKVITGKLEFIHITKKAGLTTSNSKYVPRTDVTTLSGVQEFLVKSGETAARKRRTLVVCCQTLSQRSKKILKHFQSLDADMNKENGHVSMFRDIYLLPDIPGNSNSKQKKTSPIKRRRCLAADIQVEKNKPKLRPSHKLTLFRL